MLVAQDHVFGQKSIFSSVSFSFSFFQSAVCIFSCSCSCSGSFGCQLPANCLFGLQDFASFSCLPLPLPLPLPCLSVIRRQTDDRPPVAVAVTVSPLSPLASSVATCNLQLASWNRKPPVGKKTEALQRSFSQFSSFAAGWDAGSQLALGNRHRHWEKVVSRP